MAAAYTPKSFFFGGMVRLDRLVDYRRLRKGMVPIVQRVSNALPRDDGTAQSSDDGPLTGPFA